ncbi:MAG: hypothetical protein OEV30_13605 [Ignavibacteria bacterium]|nr:hypothetical protein [Ignavibacteria bacterium]
MKTIAAVLLAALFTMTGCVSTHQVDLARPDTWVPEAQEHFLGKEIDIRTTDGTGHTGELLQLSSDSLRLRTDESASIVEKPLAQVVYLGQSPGAAGPVLGGLGGIFVGALAGGALAGSTTEPDVRSLGFNTVGATISGAMVGGIIGGVLGIVIGSLAGSVDQYVVLQTARSMTPERQENEPVHPEPSRHSE